MNLQKRSYQKELLDGHAIPFEDIRRNMQELEVINRRLGGHRITLAGIRNFLKDAGPGRTWRIVEVGCGGGDNLHAIRHWARNKGIKVELTGVDINPECIAYARSRSKGTSIRFICSDYRHLSFEAKPDLIFSALFCHHFTDEELIEQLRWKKDQSAVGFFINDLHRHPLAYHSIRLLTSAFSKSYLVRNDAPVSVQRGFVRQDWERLLVAAGIRTFHCRWMWAFRWLVTSRHESGNKHI